jgi:hypothetical protein
MGRSVNLGEIALAGVLLAIGALWVAVAAGMPMWEGFAPQSGFLPLIYGALLAALSIAVIAAQLRNVPDAGAETAEPQDSIAKPLIIVAALAGGVAGIDFIGFAASMFLMLLFLYCVVERVAPLPGVLASAATAAVLVLIFRTWLGVPLPVGPWSF